jgi:hypothetical protein
MENLTVEPPVKNKEYINYMEQYGQAFTEAARAYTYIILTTWASSTLMIFTQRLLLRKQKQSYNIYKYTITRKQLKKLDKILFTVNYTLISFLTALQLVPYGKVAN